MRVHRKSFQLIRLVPVLALLLLCGVLASPLMAQDSIEASLAVDRTEATVGDPLGLTLSITHPTNYLVVPPDIGPDWGSFVIVGRTPPETRDHGDGTATTVITFDARLFAPGAYTSPPLPVRLTDGSGNLVDAFAAPVNVTITSVLVEGDNQLRDIKPQAELPASNWLWLLLGAGLLALGVIAVVWWRRRPQPASVDSRTPGQIALDSLAAIEALRLPAAGRYQEYYTAVADTVRVFLAAAYHIPVLERTTTEIRADLATAGVTADRRAAIVRFLQDSDLVKFANFRPDGASAAQLVADARRLVIEHEALRERGGEDPGSGSAGLRTPEDPTFSNNGEGASTEVRT